MNTEEIDSRTHFKETLSFCSAIGLGLGVSTGHPLGIAAAAAMPLACLSPGTRKGAFKSSLAYYAAALWPIIPGLEAYWKSETPLIPLCFGSLLRSCSRSPGRWRGHRVESIAYGERRSRCWRQSFHLSGVIGLASPAHRNRLSFSWRGLGRLSDRRTVTRNRAFDASSWLTPSGCGSLFHDLFLCRSR